MTDTSKRSTSRNAAKTRAKILEKATDLFAASGYEGTSISDIVTASKVNKRMIYHYFGDKHGLYRAIFLQQWGELKEWFDQAFLKRVASARPVTTQDLIDEAVGIFFEFMQSHQPFVRLMMWEGLEGGEISRSIWTDVRGPLYAQMEFVIKQAQEEDLLDRRLDAGHFIVSFLGAITFYFGYASTLKNMIHQEPLEPDALKKRKEQLLLLLKNLYLKK